MGMTGDEIDALTIADVRRIAERASVALEQLRQVQSLMGGVGRAAPSTAPADAVAGHVAPSPAPAAHAEPFPCPTCRRTAPERPGEATQPQECLTCGSHLPLIGAPGVRMTNKGPMLVDVEARRALMGTPAFDDKGNPT